MNIQEVSQLTGVSKDMIRHYEKLGILHPRRSQGNYRTYETKDVHRLILARQYANTGMSLKQISVLLSGDSVSIDSQLATVKAYQLHMQRMVALRLSYLDDLLALHHAPLWTLLKGQRQGFWYYQNQPSDKKAYQDMLHKAEIFLPVFRIQQAYFDGEEYPNDAGIWLWQPLLQKELTYYPPHHYVRQIQPGKLGTYITMSEVQAFLDKVKQAGFEVAGDVFIYQLVHGLDSENAAIVLDVKVNEK